MSTIETIDSTRASLDRLQSFDPGTIARHTDLGRLNFEESVPDATKIVELFQRINPNTLRIFSENWLIHIRNHADSAFNTLKRVLDFDPSNSSNAAEERRQLVSEIRSVSDNYTDVLAPQISFSVASSLDPTATQQEMRAIIQRFSDERDAALNSVEEIKATAEAVLTRVREAAAEQGVSQQATYFKTIADNHDTESHTWLNYSILVGLGTLAFALITALTYRIPWISPKNAVEAVQLLTGKVVILGILGYALVSCVKNFMSHKHNSVVNRHRQNALLTYTAFVDAAPSTASREIVLTHAAASVFSPQETGYIRNEEPAGGKSIMEMITKATMGDKP